MKAQLQSPADTRIWGSDMLGEAIRNVDLEYMALNPEASFRRLHDSLFNHNSNRRPQMLLCLHEENAVSIVNGFAKVKNRPLGVVLHNNVGLLRGSMGIFNALCDRVPMLVFGAIGQMGNNSFPIKSIPELISYAKANPGKLSYATLSVGTPHHLGTELFKSMTGTHVVRIPYEGSIPALTDVIGGQVQVMWATVNVALPKVTSGKVRGLALAEPKRAASLKDVPVVAKKKPGYQVNAWYGIFAPAATPQAIVQQMSAELQHIFPQADVQARPLPLGYEIAIGSAEQARATVASDLDKRGKLVKIVASNLNELLRLRKHETMSAHISK